MKTEWDYTALASAYVDRPDYSAPAIDEMLRTAGVSKGMRACDVGAGVGHLAIPLLERGIRVDAVEPNDAMRALGIERTGQYDEVRWFEGTGENTGRESRTYELVTFGSSFNVTDRPRALKEAHRILRPAGWFACMWNHRDLTDSLQAAVENVIRKHLPDYGYGVRREDQTEVIAASSLFHRPVQLEGTVVHTVSAESWANAWRSHATLQRQAGDKFARIVDDIIDYVAAHAVGQIEIPYTTRIWVAQATAG
jgi:SAM-dependent methyltransferase